MNSVSRFQTLEPTSRFQTLTANNFPGPDTEEYKQQILQPLMVATRDILFRHFYEAITNKDDVKVYVLVDAFRNRHSGVNTPIYFEDANQWTKQFSALFKQAMDQAALKSKVEAELEDEIERKEMELRWNEGSDEVERRDKKELKKLKTDKKSVIADRFRDLVKKQSIEVIKRVNALGLANLNVEQLIPVTDG